MFDHLRSWLLRVLRVPPQPEPPFGDPASTKIFRASPKFYSLRLLGWSVGQLFAFLGLLAGVIIMVAVEHQAVEIRSHQPTMETAPPAQVGKRLNEDGVKPGKPSKAKRPHVQFTDELAGLVAKVPPVWFIVIWALKLLGLFFYLAQLALTYAALRLDYEMRWYVVTDRSLRIRTGLWKVQELTMSFANLQQVVLSQGPIQRLLRIADVQVQSAGGGGGGASQHGQHAASLSLHTGHFHGVDNAPEVRDLILDRLRHFRETGLGDPDETKPVAPRPPAEPTTSLRAGDATAIVAARELLAEARRLRASVQS